MNDYQRKEMKVLIIIISVGSVINLILDLYSYFKK
jgi:hypothetical protein